MAQIQIYFLSENHNRSLYIDDNNSSAWAYLKEGENGPILKDAFLYSPIEPRDELDKEAIKKGFPPTLVKKYASDTAHFSSVEEGKFRVLWSLDGTSVAILYDESPIAAIYSSEKRGFSKALSSESGFGNPWSQELFNKHFANVC